MESDSEILAIDKMEDRITPIAPNILKIRELISSLELCHHNAERWIGNIVEAIGAGESTKGLGTRAPGQRHPAEEVWQNVCTALMAWISGCPDSCADLSTDGFPARSIFTCLGAHSPLKEWQVRRVIEKINSVLHWQESPGDLEAQYIWLLLSGSDYESMYRNDCPEQHKENEDFWLTTARTMIRDTNDGNEADLSLALAIDMLWPCHWRFVKNLQIVLEAIGGNLNSVEPYAACGRNIDLLPSRSRMETVADTLETFCCSRKSNREIDKDLFALLRKPTEERKWLAASLRKTILLQLNPPAKLREISSLSGPDWIRRLSG